MSQPNQLLDPQAISRAETLGLQARFIVEGYMAGEHRSPYHGFAIEFAQHREYSPGDDVRHLDWKVLARTNRYYIKQYEQETNYVAHILMDGSESMQYGSTALTKLHYAKMMAACLAYLILHQRDAVSLGIFDTQLRDYQPRSDNRASLGQIMDRLAAFQAQHGTSIGTSLHDMARLLRRKGIIILISDLFEDEEKILQGLQHLRFAGHEVVVFHTMDVHELEFPFQGLVEFEGMENIPNLITRPHEIRQSYLREVEAFRNRVKEGCEKNNCHYVLINTATPLAEVLSSYLGFRHRTTTR